MATAQATTDHDEIRQWVEARGGHPARVKRTGSRKDPGVLRIDFPGFSGEDTLEEIEWDEFFEWFDRNDLALLLSDEEGNRFNKLVSRQTAGGGKSSSRRGSKSSSGRGSKSSSAKKASASTKKASSSAKKASSSTKKASGSTKKASASTKKASTSAKKATTSKKTTKKASTSTKKATTSKKTTKKTSTSTKKASSTRRLVGSTTRRSAGSTTSKKTTKRATTRGASSTTTTDHDEIRQWVEARGGFPAHVKRTGSRRGDLGVLRIDYPGYSGRDTLERIDWDDWFDAFERNKLAFLYQDKRNSRFSKLVNR